MISGTNQSKSVVSPYGTRKAGIFLWADTLATWADATAVWGGVSITPTNQNKTSNSTVFLITDEADFLVTDEGDYLCVSIGGEVTNQSKS